MEFVMPIIRTICPENMKGQKCPVYEYVEKNQDVFHISINESYLMPNTDDTEKINNVVKKMREICNKCKINNTVKIK